MWQYSPVCVGPGRKPRRPVFSQRGSYDVVQFVGLDDLLIVPLLVLRKTILTLNIICLCAIVCSIEHVNSDSNNSDDTLALALDSLGFLPALKTL